MHKQSLAAVALTVALLACKSGPPPPEPPCTKWEEQKTYRAGKWETKIVCVARDAPDAGSSSDPLPMYLWW